MKPSKPQKPAPEQGFRHLSPFGEDAKEFEVTAPLDVSQFKAELEAKVGFEVHIALVQEDPFTPTSEDSPGVLFVSPESIDGRTVHGLIQTHEVDPDFHMTEADKTKRALREKIAAGEALSPQETTQALSVLLGAG